MRLRQTKWFETVLMSHYDVVCCEQQYQYENSEAPLHVPLAPPTVLALFILFLFLLQPDFQLPLSLFFLNHSLLFACFTLLATLLLISFLHRDLLVHDS